MTLLLEASLALPFKDPVLIFALILGIILVVPLLFKQLRMPGIIGLIIAGVIIGPNGLNLLQRDSSIVLFGTVGLMYIMFLAGLEIDLDDFRKNRYSSGVFGLLSFFIPQLLGMLASFYILGFGVTPSVLLGGLLGSHTLLAYPIASKLGIGKSRSATISVGGTMIADLLALLVLAIIAETARGQLNTFFWIRLVLSLLVYAFAIIWGLPRVSRWFFRTVESEGVLQYLFVLTAVFVTAFLAELAGLEAIIGAFLAGLVLNRLIPHSSPLMNRIEFVGNAVFIPFFLISVGMLVDLRVLFKGAEAWIIAGVMIGVATAGKWLAAFFTQVLFSFSSVERSVIFGLTNARAAATLTAVLVGYELKILDESVLNGAVLMILVTCVVSSLVVENAGRTLALTENAKQPDRSQLPDRILVPISNPATIEQLMDFAILLKEYHSLEPILALTVVKDAHDTETQLVSNRKMLQRAILHAAATDNTVQLVSRIDMNIAGGILRAIREMLVTKVIIGWNGKVTTRQRIFGSILDNLLAKSNQLIMVCKLVHPLNTMNRILVLVPPNAELERGFITWVTDIRTLGKQIGASVTFFCNPSSWRQIQAFLESGKISIEAEYRNFENWNSFQLLANEVTADDLLLVVSARPGTVSHEPHLDKMPRLLSRHFENKSFIIVYPEQISES